MTAVISVRDLAVRFHTRRGLLTALNGVSFDDEGGETLGLVGESGCGKSTLGKAIVGLVKPARGSIRLGETEIVGLGRRAMRSMRGGIQMIFQDPFASLNPRLTVGRIIEEPLIVHRIGSRDERRARVQELLRRVGLAPEAADAHPHEFSGGQRQRIGIARALALNPKVLVADEPVSALDVSVQGQVINLLNDLQQEFGLSYLFISHDLSVVQHIADRVIVMYLGRIVEIAHRRDLWSFPLHPYTRLLFDAIPVADPAAAREQTRRIPEGEIPSPLNPPSGCHFRTRCTHATDTCAEQDPPLVEVVDGRWAACHYVVRDHRGQITVPGPQATHASPDR